MYIIVRTVDIEGLTTSDSNIQEETRVTRPPSLKSIRSHLVWGGGGGGLAIFPR